MRREDEGLGEDPLNGADPLQDTFYRPAVKARPPKPEHYKVISISMYLEDIEQLDAMVAELKKRGHTKANRSQLIRHALSVVDLESVPKPY
ncbi:MAG: hypothetical protein AAGD10_03800 [Myxococcota bacterium]